MPNDQGDNPNVQRELSPAQQIRLEEYRTLSSEVHKRTELRDQSLNLLFVAAGTIWTVGTATGEYIVFLLFPWLALALALGFAANVMVLRELGVYIREGVEKRLPPMGWTQHFAKVIEKNTAVGNPSAYLLFGGTQIFSIAMYVFLNEKKCVEWSGSKVVPALLALVPLTYTMYLLKRSLNYKPWVDPCE